MATVTPPSNINCGTVVGQFVLDVVDSEDPDHAPDFVTPTGTVTFVASVGKLLDATAAPNPVTILRTPIPAVLDDAGYVCTPDASGAPAYRGVQLIATDDPDLNPSGWLWNVTYAFKGQDGRALGEPQAHQIAVPTNGTIDLGRVIPPDGAQVIGIPQAEALAAQAVTAATEARALVAAAEAAAAASAAAAGVVKSPTPPADTSKTWLDTSSTVHSPASAMVYLSGAATIPTGFGLSEALQVVPFDTSAFVDAGISWNNAAWADGGKRFTIAEGGRYRLNVQVGTGVNATGGRWVEIWSSRNNRIYGQNSYTATPGTVNAYFQAATPIFQYDAGTQFWARFRHTGGADLSLVAGAQTWFTIERVG